MLNDLAKQIHENAVNHGWWNTPPTFGELIALCHSELSEALEDYRNGMEPSEAAYTCTGCYYECEQSYYLNDCVNKYGSDYPLVPKPEGIPSELADTIIRILDMCGAYNINIDEVLAAKMKYNETRPYLHGGKKL